MNNKLITRICFAVFVILYSISLIKYGYFLYDIKDSTLGAYYIPGWKIQEFIPVIFYLIMSVCSFALTKHPYYGEKSYIVLPVVSTAFIAYIWIWYNFAHGKSREISLPYAITMSIGTAIVIILYLVSIIIYKVKFSNKTKHNVK